MILFQFYLSLRYIIEQVDAISVLIRNSTVEPTKLLMRGIIESYLGINYILEKDTTKRSMSFMIVNAHEKIKLYKKFDKKTKEGKEFHKKLSDNEIMKNIVFPESLEFDKYVLNLENLIMKPQYKEAEIEYKRTRSSKKHPYWYSLYNGPSNLESLARYLKMSFVYEIFYRSWSGAIHATDIIDGKDSTKRRKILFVTFEKSQRCSIYYRYCDDIFI